jgi:hypothetical protein
MKRVVFVSCLSLCAASLIAASLIFSGCFAQADPCEGVTCSGHGTCVATGGQAACECEQNYHAEALNCVFDGYKLNFTWAFGPEGKTCTQALVGQVRVQLEKDSASLLDQTMNCSANGAVIEKLQNGTYQLKLTGIANNGENWYYGAWEVTISDKDLDAGQLKLDPIGFMKFSWDFGDGHLDCTAARVAKVRIKINTEDGATNLYTSNPVPDCTAVPQTIGDFVLGNYNLVLEASCASDPFIMGYQLDATVEVSRTGENNYGVITLPINGTGCP